MSGCRAAIVANTAIVAVACASSPQTAAPAREASPLSSASAPSLPPACVRDVESATLAALVEEGTVPSEERRFREASLADVDGDGASERLIAVPYLCGATGNCSYVLFVSNHGCVRMAGVLPAVTMEREASSHQGWRDLRGWMKGGCVGAEGTSTRYERVGDTYVPKESVECSCPADDAAFRCAVRPKHCPCDP